MRKKVLCKIFSCILLAVLIAAVALCNVGCKTKQTDDVSSVAITADTKEIGSGITSFTLTVVDDKEKSEVYKVKTDKETVGDALLELSLIDGEESEYGLYVKTVNGITLDADKDRLYWSFYIDGAYANTGIDLTKIENGKKYELKAEKY